MSAMIKVVGSEGLQAASVRTIAKAAGCNEAVLYQHFSSKLAMQQAIYEEIVTEMANEKQEIARTSEDPRTLPDAGTRKTRLRLGAATARSPFYPSSAKSAGSKHA